MATNEILGIIKLQLILNKIMLKVAFFSVLAVSLNFFFPIALDAKPQSNKDIVDRLELPSSPQLTLKRTNHYEERLNKVKLGQTHSYTLTTTNKGSIEATNIILSEDLSDTTIDIEEIGILHTEGTIPYDRDRYKNVAIVHLGKLLFKQQM